MVVHELIKKANISVKAQGGTGNPEISDICYDSRTVSPGALYVAIPGTRVHGDTFIKDAIARGAVAVISEQPQYQVQIPWFQCSNVRTVPGELGRALWNVNMNMVLVGITGTNGKTTTAHLFEQLMRQRSHESVWMFGTIDYHLGNEYRLADHTTPEALDIFRYIGAASCRPECVIMEVSSHSLALDRIGGLSYDVAVFTNLTQDHLDFHNDMESYYQAKKRLFTVYLKQGGHAVINTDDPWGKRLAGELSQHCITFGQSADALVRINSWQCTWDGSSVEIETAGKTSHYHSSLRGYFNVYNMAALIAGGIALGFSPDVIQHAFDSITTVPGRMERVIAEASFAVIIDYAHTPDALVNILQTSRCLTNGKLICVFGCGGDRDKKKRPIMGRVVAEHSDEAIVTSDNPRTERPQAIINDILDGIPLDFPHLVIPDRREAIGIALSRAGAGDCIVIAGKGHENYQEIAGVRHHFDDKEVVLELYGAKYR